MAATWSSSSSTSGDRSTPPTRGTSRRIGVSGGAHVTDVTNASRTLLMNLHTLDWDDEILAGSVLTRDGVIVNEGVRARVEGGAQ